MRLTTVLMVILLVTVTFAVAQNQQAWSWINTATVSELDLLEGIGPKLAASIVAYRDANGAFEQPTDLCRVKRIGPVVLARIFGAYDRSVDPPVNNLPPTMIDACNSHKTGGTSGVAYTRLALPQ